jgi:hypothetical protein
MSRRPAEEQSWDLLPGQQPEPQVYQPVALPPVAETAPAYGPPATPQFKILTNYDGTGREVVVKQDGNGNQFPLTDAERPVVMAELARRRAALAQGQQGPSTQQQPRTYGMSTPQQATRQSGSGPAHEITVVHTHNVRVEYPEGLGDYAAVVLHHELGNPGISGVQSRAASTAVVPATHAGKGLWGRKGKDDVKAPPIPPAARPEKEQVTTGKIVNPEKGPRTRDDSTTREVGRAAFRAAKRVGIVRMSSWATGILMVAVGPSLIHNGVPHSIPEAIGDGIKTPFQVISDINYGINLLKGNPGK